MKCGSSRLDCLWSFLQHLLKVQEEYKRKEAELEKVKDDKLQMEKMLENLKEKVHESSVNLCPCPPAPTCSGSENALQVPAVGTTMECLAEQGLKAPLWGNS